MPRLILPGDSPGPEYKYALVDVGRIEPSDLVVKNGWGLEVRPNSGYPLGAQGRSYGSASLASDALRAAASKPRLDYLLDRTATPAFGPPVVVADRDDARFFVVAGHQRAAVLRYQNEEADAEAFWAEYEKAARAMYPDLYVRVGAASAGLRVVVRLLEINRSDDLRPEVLTSALRVLNRLSDAPITKPRDALAVVKGLAAEILELPTLRGVLAGCLPPGSELLEEEGEQGDIFGAEGESLHSSTSDNKTGVRPASTLPVLQIVARRLESADVQERLYVQLFKELRTHRIGDTELHVPLLTEQDELAVYRREGDRRLLTDEAKKAFAFLAVAVGLGDGEVVERLAEVRTLYSRFGRRGTVPGRTSLPSALEVSRTVLITDGFRRARDAGVLRLLGHTVLVELALHPTVIEALRQPLLAGDSRPALAWVREVIERTDAVASYVQLQVDRAQWERNLRARFRLAHSLNSVGTPEITRQISELRRLFSVESHTSEDQIFVALALSFQSTTGLLPRQQASVGQDSAGRGRPSVRPIDIAFSLFCLAAMMEWPSRRVPSDLATIRAVLKPGLTRYDERLRKDLELLGGTTYGCAPLHAALRARSPALARVQLPRVVGVRALWMAVQHWSESEGDVERLRRILKAGRNAPRVTSA